MTFERILSHFQVRKRGTGKAQCICPAHADREASLTLTDRMDYKKEAVQMLQEINDDNLLEFFYRFIARVIKNRGY